MKVAETNTALQQIMLFVFLYAHHSLLCSVWCRAWQNIHMILFLWSRALFFFWHMELIRDGRLVNAGIAQLESCFQVLGHWRNSEIKYQAEPLLWASELSSLTKKPILKKLLLVERSTIKLLRAGLHHCSADKDQEVWLYSELFGVSV